MKNFAFFALVALVGYTTAETEGNLFENNKNRNFNFRLFLVHSHIEPYIFEDKINETIEALRPDIPDPLKIANLTIAIPEDFTFVK